jgi:ribose-phosphate pyrophosphokinase
MKPIVLPAPGSAELAEQLADRLDAPLGVVEYRRFPDGETFLRLHTDVQGHSVVIAASLRDPDPQALGLWFLSDVAREMGARHVGLVAPYLPYMRQDTRFHPGEAVTSRTFARFVSQGVDWLVTVDPHLHRLPSLVAIYSVPAVAVSSAHAVARWISANVRRPYVIGPDEESRQWVEDVAQRVGCGFTVLEKRRLGDRKVEVSTPMPDTENRTPVLLDDIVSSGHTLAQAVRQVRLAFACRPVCLGVHAVFSGAALQVVKDAGAERIVTCNTLPHETNEIDVLGDVAFAISERQWT